ncbi:MAG: hypothetical protein A2161_20375 [Candidatus Schekmanbacteria bacterium RBG_13_48_7]|uniref:Response regulatory domain-containing protein n=1 Tax=Candidatus Schekmanbacteria bacterium RBG_13_48_7 TaxID=1817878 RepID=A0A1F7RP51_9BACT|nr:MAG: hypothetical protein A2161_20375 [Candidatus Schekmanbacteria bacterium RBG_13_48_7]
MDSASKKRGRILVVEDNPPILEQVIQILETNGYTTYKAVDGMDAITKAKNLIPDLIILDVVLPKINGFQVCRLLKNTQQFKSIPVIILSGKKDQSDRDWGIKIGADFYLTKPIESTKLLETVSKFIIQ